jgi:beta-N-acetylhexosaminidase
MPDPKPEPNPDPIPDPKPEPDPIPDPKPEPDPDPTPVDPMEAYILAMSLEERIGQLFIARCPSKNAVNDIKAYHLGGYVLFARDFEDETPKSVIRTIATYQSASHIPMLIAVDEEGGKVNRVSKYPAFRATPFLSPREIYTLGGLEALKENEEEKSILLSSLGINVNLSPVCDITTDPEAFMYPRSLGESPEITGQFVQEMLKTMSQNGIGGVLKHFPGYGNNTDTHIAIAIDNRSLAELENCDLVPFQMGIDAGCGAIMVSHTFINAIDPDLPATLSPKVNAYLREKMSFDGVVVTDDLVMQAITDLYGDGEAAVLAVLAGNDLLCSTQYKTQYTAVLQAVENGRISEDRINEAVRRILQWKCDMGLMDV